MPALRATASTHMRGRALPWVLAAIAVAAAAWWYLAPQTIPAALRGALPASPKAIPEVYKWKDDKGRVQFTSTPPSDRPYETLRYDPNMNVMPSSTQSPSPR